jgi:multidrug efflux pump subunit AcrB
MWIVRLALRRPYTFIVMACLIVLLGGAAMVTMPVDIFPHIDIPVVSVIWGYTGISPEEMEKRIVTVSERGMTTTVNDIEHIESQSYNGAAVIRLYFQPNVKIDMALAQVSAACESVLRVLPPGQTPPNVLKYDASSVPILQIGLSSPVLSEQTIADLGQNFIRTQLATVQGATIPLPFGGKFKQVMVDLNPDAMQARGLSALDVSNALGLQNLILPAGTAKFGDREYQIKVNSSPRTVEELNNLPVKTANGSVVYMRDVAQVRDGFAVQANIIRRDGRRGALLTVMRNGQASTLDIVDKVKTQLPLILAGLTRDLQVRTFFDQSLFVRAAIQSVLKEALTAALLTGLMILLFLGSWRSTVIVCISIPLSILVSLIVLNQLGETINTMTLGGMALAVGILVDDATVELENTHRNMAMRKPMVRAVLDGASQIAVPAFVSTLAICIVFVPVLLLTGAARFLFTPLALAVVFAMLASYLLSRTLVPTLVYYMLRPEIARYQSGEHGESDAESASGHGFFYRFHLAFNRGFGRFRDIYSGFLEWSLAHRRFALIGFFGFSLASLGLLPFVGRDFFPDVDAGLIRLHVRAPSGTRIEQTEILFAQVEDEIRATIAPGDLDTILDNIGLPFSSINLALGDNQNTGPSDGDIQIALKEDHQLAAARYVAILRQRLHARFPDATVYFEAANMTSQILNFGLPAPIDVQVAGRNIKANYAMAQELQRRIERVPGAADVHIHQIVDYPEIRVNVDRSRAAELGMSQQDVTSSVLISLSGSTQVAPSYWLNWNNGVNYTIGVQTPQYAIPSLDVLLRTPVNSGGLTRNSNTSLANPTASLASLQAGPAQSSAGYGNPGSLPSSTQLLSNVATTIHGQAPLIVSHYNVQPAFDVFANIDRTDLGSVGDKVTRIVNEMRPKLVPGASISIRGQLQTMQSSFTRLGLGLILAVTLVYLLMVLNFQSWLDPFIILMPLPGAMAGILWMLFITQTTLSVPSLMGAIMCIGVATANSILMVVFANDERLEGLDARAAALSAGVVRVRPVLMTAAAMILGMLPMSLGMGEGGEQNAPLGRAVIGGLLVATVSTLFVVPMVYSLLRTKPPVDHEALIVKEENE